MKELLILNSLIVKARIKLVLITIFITGFIYITTNLLNTNLPYQISLFSIFTVYYIIMDREQLKIYLNFTRFLFLVIVLIHSIFFLFKTLSMGFEFAQSFYIERGSSIIIRVFIIPNIFAFVNIVIGKLSFIDLLLISKNSLNGKTVYILMISGIEVMERLRIYYEYHPLNMKNRGREKIIHYLAIPLTLFFGISRGFESKYKTLIEREEILRSEK